MMTKNIILTAGVLLLPSFFFFNTVSLLVRLWLPFWDSHIFFTGFCQSHVQPPKWRARVWFWGVLL
jgi:hypothetical protein